MSRPTTVMRHVFKPCMEDRHTDCEGLFLGQIHRGECVCPCHLAEKVREFLIGQTTRVQLQTILRRYQDFLSGEVK